MTMKPLTDKEKLFADEYLANGLNGTQAAIKAGYSAKSASVIGSQILAKLNVRSFIDQKLDERKKKLGMTIDWKLEKLQLLIDFSIKNNAEGRPYDINHKALLGAIAEANKMQGHYAAIKVDQTTRTDDTKAKVEELIKQNQRPF